MTPAQHSLYWRLWSAACMTQGWKQLSPAEQDARRHAAHATALGRDKSSHHLDNRDLDSIFATFKALADPLHPGADPATARRLTQDPGEKKRLLHRIARLAPDRYARQVALDTFGTTYLDNLSIAQLTQLSDTLLARRRAVGSCLPGSRRTLAGGPPQLSVDIPPHQQTTDRRPACGGYHTTPPPSSPLCSPPCETFTPTP